MFSTNQTVSAHRQPSGRLLLSTWTDFRPLTMRTPPRQPTLTVWPFTSITDLHSNSLNYTENSIQITSPMSEYEKWMREQTSQNPRGRDLVNNAKDTRNVTLVFLMSDGKPRNPMERFEVGWNKVQHKSRSPVVHGNWPNRKERLRITIRAFIR